MRLSRSRSVDHFRQIVDEVDEENPVQYVRQLRSVLTQVPEAQYLLNDREVSSIMNEIEMELGQTEDEKQANLVEMETDDLVERHSTSCLLCGQRSTEGSLCSHCRSNLQREL